MVSWIERSSVPFCGAPPLPSDLIWRWNTDVTLLAALAGFAAVLVIMRRSPDMATRPAWAALALLAVLFISPLCALTSALFTARVAHHVILIAVCAPLIAMSVRRAGNPLVAIQLGFWLQFIVLWFWHAPPAYALSLQNDGVYWLMQFTLLGAAVLFWRGVLAGGDPFRTMVLLLGTAIHMGLLGAVITFAPEPLYAFHGTTTQAWGLTPLGDQQLGGLVMWVPAALPYLAVLVAMAMRWADEERPSSAL